MRPDIPWNVAGIPPEAREAARTAARREGLSVGEWMTRRILDSFSDGSVDVTREARPANGTELAPLNEAAPSRRDTEDMLAHVARSETESGEVFRRIEEQLRGVARRLEAAERNQFENNRAMSKAANEINIAAREQAQAFDQLGNSVVGLADRIDRVERLGAQDGMKDAVKGLHQGLSRLADQISATANQSATQISALADNLESVASRASQARSDAEASTRAFEQRIAQIDDRVRSVERLAQAAQETVQHALSAIEGRRDDDAAAQRRAAETASAIARLEDKLARIETGSGDAAIDRRLSSIERSLGDIAGRFEKTNGPAPLIAGDLKRLTERIDSPPAKTSESDSPSRTRIHEPAGRIATAQTASSPEIVSQPSASSPSAEFDSVPPFPDTARPDNAPPFSTNADPFATVATAVTSPLPAPAESASAVVGNPNIANEPMNLAAMESMATSESFLSAARRSARAASAQVETERSARAGGFAWGTVSGSIAAESKPENRNTKLWIAIIVLLVIAAVGAGAILSKNLNPRSPRSVAALFGRATSNAPAPSVPRLAAIPHAARAASPEMSTVVVHPTPSSTAPAGTGTTPANPSQVVHAAAPASPPAAAPHNPPAATSVPSARAASVSPALRSTAALSPLDKLTALANSGNARAELVVGLKYLDGDGVAVNEVDAAKWLARAADQGQAVAQYRLGTMFDRGRGVAQDSAKAVHWYTLAAQAGNRKAMHNLAVAYASGTGIGKNLAEAARWFSKAAALGLSDSQFNLAVLYERGLGVPQSLIDAYKWYAIAAATGDAESKARTDALATQLTADARTAAQHSAAVFHAQPLDVKANVAPLMSDVTG